ncbi:MAG: hypothetical protein NW200_04775 [Hyphomonadaceae bacterium]|nr:hypothetical protein [Hyphomonadaceae bacterium]
MSGVVPWLRIARLLLEIVAWLVRESARREGEAAVRAALAGHYERTVDELLAKARAAHGGVPGADDPRVRDDDGFRRD